ncbi:MAG TPA: glucosaminidase domain-containing protein [Ktedonobacteraceae bacterium]|nr:glucosaminidase domain-containing protein [Ktedonobacteraceae bacterium]
MASGNYAKKPAPQPASDVQSKIPARATRRLPDPVDVEEIDDEVETVAPRRKRTNTLPSAPASTDTIHTEPILTRTKTKTTNAVQQPYGSRPLATFGRTTVVDTPRPTTLQQHGRWLKPAVIAMLMAVLFSAILVSAALIQRPGGPQLINYFGGQVYSVQVGGNLANTWQPSKPLPPKVNIPAHPGPYSVLGKPTLSVAFINQVLGSYGSPAAGKGQALYDLGVKYQIDPAFALAFFFHESGFGTAGEARKTLSLGNLRCIPNAACVDRNPDGTGGYASFPTWEAGFEAWYKLIRNLYVAQLGLVTVDQIIPTYAPTADHNNEAAYIGSLKHELDVWHAGILKP